MGGRQLSAFGLQVESDFPLPVGSDGVLLAANTSLSIRRASIEAVAGSLSAGPELVWATSFDGCDYRMDRGSAGDYRFTWAERAVFHLTAAADVLTCGLREPDDLGAMRLLLDTVLWSVSLVHGYELLHASAVCRGEAAVAFVAGTGVGKTSLAAELIHRGAALLSDDVVALSYQSGRVMAHPGPPLMNVPLGPRGRPHPSDLGQTLAQFGDEAWVNVEVTATSPPPLTAIYVLERDDLLSTQIEQHPMEPLALLPHALGFPGSRSRLGRQFEILSDLIAQARVMRLSVGPDSSPATLADLVERDLVGSSTLAGVG